MLWLVIIATVVAYLLLDWLIRLPRVGNYSNKSVFITGCGNGFGRELAIRLDKMGFPVFAACRTEDGRRSLEEVCSSRLVTLSLNVDDPSNIQEAFKFVKQRLPNERGLWAVVNNAGRSGIIVAMEMTPLDEYISMCATNLFGYIGVTKTFAPLLRKSQGRLVFMASAAGRYAAVHGAYSITKYGIEAFGDICRRELSAFGVKVSIIEPGYFKTNILNQQRLLVQATETYTKADQEVREAYGKDHLDSTVAVINAMQIYASPDVYKVVDAYVSALTSLYPRPRYVVGTDAKLLFVPLSFLPEWIADKIFISMNKLMCERAKQINKRAL